MTLAVKFQYMLSVVNECVVVVIDDALCPFEYK